MPRNPPPIPARRPRLRQLPVRRRVAVPAARPLARRHRQRLPTLWLKRWRVGPQPNGKRMVRVWGLYLPKRGRYTREYPGEADLDQDTMLATLYTPCAQQKGWRDPP